MSGTPFSNVNKQSMVPEDQKNMKNIKMMVDLLNTFVLLFPTVMY